MEKHGHECVAFCEVDKFARKAYKAVHDTKGEEEWHDIREVDERTVKRLMEKEGEIECICGGFPCQSFSIAGKRGGFDDTRGTLFFEIMRIANIVKPRYLFLENVKGLLNHDSGNTFETILRTLDEYGYDVQWQCVNSKNFGTPQNRQRVFIVASSRGYGGGKQGSIRRNILPIRRTDETGNLEGIKTVATYTYPSFRVGQQIVGVEGIFPTLTTKHHVGDTAKIAVVENGKKRVRKLTPLEYWRLQGFPDDKFWLAEATGLSHHQLYKQAGNSVTVNVIEEIASRL